jgi:hypothetical protein
MGGKAAQQVGGGIQGHHPPGLEHGDTPAEGLRLLQVMGGEDDGVAVPVELADELPQPLAQLHVHPRGGLVQHDHRRAMDQRLGHQDAALHAAGEGPHVGVRLGGEVQAGQDFVDPVVVMSDAEVAGLDAQHLADSEEGVEHQFLGHHPELAAGRPVVRHHIVAHHRQIAAVAAQQARQGRDEGGLAGAVGAQQAEEFALGHLQIDAGEGLEAPIGFDDGTNPDGGRGHGIPPDSRRRREFGRQEGVDTVKAGEDLKAFGQRRKLQGAPRLTG